MPPLNPPQSAILYQSSFNAVTLLDIPLSISLAQGTSDHPNHERIYSTEPLQHPHPSTEPKTQRAKKNVKHAMILGNAPPPFPTKLLDEALEEIKAYYRGDEWCLPRQVLKERREEEMITDNAPEDEGGKRKPELQSQILIPLSGRCVGAAKRQKSRAICKNAVNSFDDTQGIAYRLFHNPHSTLLSFAIISPPQTYNIPSGSTFYLASIDQRSAAHFSSAVQAFYSTPTATASPGQFDLILLDPPWDNRSVKRSRGYSTACQQQQHPVKVLDKMLGQHIAPNGLVACWITNNRTARAWTMKAFETWGIELCEEWAWLKTTVAGNPVADLEGVWRKPYEILLLGRQVDYFKEDVLTDSASKRPVLQKVIVAVPDIHSRKPCIKELLESLITNRQHIRALEIFARNLTAGWCSWGNEVIKYNRQSYWAKAAQDLSPSINIEE